jgi:hypothetical protein
MEYSHRENMIGSSNRKTVAKICLIGTLLTGLLCLACGATLDTMIPHFLLDVVLTPEELADGAVRDRTLSMLKQVKSGQAGYWFLTGSALLILSAVGLWSLRSEQNSQ